ncbi:MAG: terminase family protein, partial [Pseudomonadota bacterium]
QYWESEFNADTGTRYKTQEVSFPNGSRITALPANPDTARGFTANVLLDEFAFHQDSRKIWRALYPVISAPGLKLRVVSTPNGKGNKFHDLMTGKDDNWSRHVVNIEQAVADGLPRDIKELRQNAGDEDLWRQEYMLEWLDEAHAWFPYSLITSCEHAQAGRPDLYEGGPCYIGNDIAIRNDLWVTWVLEKVGDVLWTREIRCLKNAPFAAQDATMDELFARYDVRRACMDQTGIGEKPVEDAIRRYGKSRVEGVIFNTTNKQSMAGVAKETLEDKKIRIPADDTILRADLHKLQRVVGPTGIPRFVADSDSTGHADRAWAMMLAVSASISNYQPYAYHAAQDEGGGFDAMRGML